MHPAEFEVQPTVRMFDTVHCIQLQALDPSRWYRDTLMCENAAMRVSLVSKSIVSPLSAQIIHFYC